MGFNYLVQEQKNVYFFYFCEIPEIWSETLDVPYIDNRKQPIIYNFRLIFHILATTLSAVHGVEKANQISDKKMMTARTTIQIWLKLK